MLHVGDVVRKLRLRQGLTIPELATEAGVNHKTISSIEHNERPSTPETLGLVAHALGLADSRAFDQILDDWCIARIGPPRLKPSWREVVTLWDQLDGDPEVQRLLLLWMRREAKLRPTRRRASTTQNSPATDAPLGRDDTATSVSRRGTSPRVPVPSAAAQRAAESDHEALPSSQTSERQASATLLTVTDEDATESPGEARKITRTGS